VPGSCLFLDLKIHDHDRVREAVAVQANTLGVHGESWRESLSCVRVRLVCHPSEQASFDRMLQYLANAWLPRPLQAAHYATTFVEPQLRQGDPILPRPSRPQDEWYLAQPFFVRATSTTIRSAALKDTTTVISDEPANPDITVASTYSSRPRSDHQFVV
jgi:hypothetical protein